MKRKRKRGSIRVWSKEEDALLLTMKDDGCKEEEIAGFFGVTRSQLSYRLLVLGYYDNAHSYTRKEVPSDRPVCLPVDEAMRVAYRLVGMKDLEYNPRGESITTI